VLDRYGANIPVAVEIQQCVVIEVFGLSNLGGTKFNVNRISVLEVFDLYGVNDRSKTRCAAYLLSGPLDSLVGRRSPLASSSCGETGGINQKTQRPVHRVGIGECFRQIGLDEYQVCSSHGPFVVFAADATFELRQVILRPQLVIDFLC
jgi:hypothetical protein